MPALVLGPLLRYAGETEATIWVETDAACTVEVLGRSTETFHAEGHHYALVILEGLEPACTVAYEVHLDGEKVWPQADSDFPPSVIRTHDAGRPIEIKFGSCRVCVPHEEPYSLPKEEHDAGREVDALRALAMQMEDEPPEQWPHALILLGDQVYADEVSPATLEYIRGRRDTELPPYETVADFEEYTHLYREAWSEPFVRWLFSTVPTAMIFDDHDVHDDWNTSLQWVRDIRAQGWWDERIVGGFATYWIYQHLGNLSPRELAEDALWQRLCEHPSDDVGPVLREWAFEADRAIEGTRWSFCRDIGTARLVMIDSRAGRVLTPGERAMVDDAEWRWIEETATGDHDHLLLGTSLPLLLGRGLHYLEAWNEAICDGAWGPPGAFVGEKLRQGLDLEHWAAFQDSFNRMSGLLEAVGSGRRGAPPASIVTLSGDVHHAYLAEVGFPREAGVRSHVYQATCSPFRNPLDDKERRVVRFGTTRMAEGIGRALARTAGVKDPPIRWRFVHDDPWFDNQVATIRLEGRKATMWIDKTVPSEAAEGGEGRLHLERVFERPLA